MTDEEITQLNLPLSSPNPNTLLPDEVLHEATHELAELIIRYWKKQKQFDHDNEAIDYE